MSATVRGVSVEGRSGSRDEDRVREYTVVYKVTTDDRNDGAAIAMEAFGIPNIGDQFNVGNDFDPAAVCVSKSADQGDSPWDWLVEATFSSKVDNADATENPLDEPADITYGFQQRRILVPGRFNDPAAPPYGGDWQAGIYAPNGELFNPQPEVEINEPVLRIKRNVGSIDPQSFLVLANAVNADPFQGAEPRQLKLGAPEAARKFNKEIGFYWEVSYSIVFRWETWDIQVLNQGTFYWESGAPIDAIWSSTAIRKTKNDAQGNPLVINLTTAGAVNTTSTPTFTRIRFYRELIFANLGLI